MLPLSPVCFPCESLAIREPSQSVFLPSGYCRPSWSSSFGGRPRLVHPRGAAQTRVEPQMAVARPSMTLDRRYPPYSFAVPFRPILLPHDSRVVDVARTALCICSSTVNSTRRCISNSNHNGYGGVAWHKHKHTGIGTGHGIIKQSLRLSRGTVLSR